MIEALALFRPSRYQYVGYNARCKDVHSRAKSLGELVYRPLTFGSANRLSWAHAFYVPNILVSPGLTPLSQLVE